MRKVLLSFLIGCMGFISSHASNVIYQGIREGNDGDRSLEDYVKGGGGTFEDGNLGDLTGGRPLVPPAFQDYYDFEYDSASSTLSIYYSTFRPFTPGSLGLLFVSVTNIFTGEIYCYFFDDLLGEAVIPFAGDSGIWRLCLSTNPVSRNPMILYRCFFTIENGMLMKL